MNVFPWLREFTLVFSLALAVTAAVSFLWSLMAHGSGAVDWESALRFWIILGIVLAWIKARETGRVN